MTRVDELVSSLFVCVKDTNSDKITRLAIPSDVQIGLVDNPSALDLFGRFSISTKDFTSTDENDGVIIVSNDDTIVAVTNNVTPLSGRLTVKLPANPKNGQLHFIKDASGDADIVPIDIVPNDNVLIDQFVNRTIVDSFGSMALFWFSDRWHVLVTGVGASNFDAASPLATYLTAESEPSLVNSRIFTSSSNISVTDNTTELFVDLTDTTVVPGTYELATVTVDQKGRITDIASGSLSLLFPQLVLSGGTQTLTSSYLNKTLAFWNSASISVTIPNAASSSFELGSVLRGFQAGPGQVTFVTASGVSIRSAESLKLRKQWSMCEIVKLSTNEWIITGDLELA